MHYTLHGLLNDQPVEKWYRDAAKHWREALGAADQTNPVEIAKIAELEQTWFEQNCGGRFIGQEVMVISGIVQFYTTTNGFDGNESRVEAMVKGLLKSGCSIEIPMHTRDICRAYEELEQFSQGA